MTLSAMYPGTFDPITLGHEDFIRRVAKLYKNVVVAVAADTEKKTTVFSLEERVALAKETLSGFGNVKVKGYDGLTIDFARANGLSIIVRGLRAVSDFEYEFQLASMNRHLSREIETVFLTPVEKYAFISSSLVREIAILDGDIDNFVSKNVKHALLKKVSLI
ncbi:MAG: pantetheine-phosphate adenylyltransferase [Gammaproteobacteria bacterium]|nr:pantetheine-phosphate adenylyltransferase [Gammaproteobacteria bacterium]|tara:strand:+ start:1407 stop:1895 length:489 start_codon:yes stop_codon:yes gene_type:complete